MCKPVKIAIVFFFLGLFHRANGQFGLHFKSNINSMKDWTTPAMEGNLFSPQWEVGLDYWFRLKKYRIEFSPELYFGIPKKTVFQSGAGRLIHAGFQFNTLIYLFDLPGDCNCPTFSKQGPSLEKGFFVVLSPGFMWTKFSANEIDNPPEATTAFLPRMGAGIGYDIGISDLITLTPIIKYYAIWGAEWNDIKLLDNDIKNSETSWNQLQFELRIGLRPDYVKKYGRYRR